MGMAASQARLLTITARIHDVEYQAQSIQNAKVQLATQSDQVYQEYLDALDATTLTVKDYNGNVITANFNNLWGKNAVDTGNSYALFSSKGALIVSDEEKEAYDAYHNAGGNDPYEFAVYMLDGGQGYTVGTPETTLGSNVSNGEDSTAAAHPEDTTLTKYQKSLDEYVSEFVSTGNFTGNSSADIEDICSCGYGSYSSQMDGYLATYQDQLDANTIENLEKIIENCKTTELSYKNRLYSCYGEEVYTAAGGDSVNYDEDLMNYYIDLFKKIEAAGGNCISIDDYNEGNNNSDAANDSEWLKNMIECGKISISTISKDNKTGEISYDATSPSTDTYLEYTTTTTIDKTAYAKAEAEYEHKTKEIDAKDSKYDMDLSKLETERQALTTEYDSVKKVIQDNIERTFGIFG